MSFKPSSYQNDIFDFIRKGTGNGIVKAVAGSGKTTTLVKAASYLNGSAIFCAFNNHVKDELNNRFKSENINGIKATTIHSLGFKCVRRGFKDVNLQEYKYYELLYDDKSLFRIAKLYKDIQERKLREAINAHIARTNDVHELEEALSAQPDSSQSVVPHVENIMIELANLVRLTLTPFTKQDFADLIDHYNIGVDLSDEEEFDLFFTEATDLIKKGNVVAEKTGVIDFCDMLYLPHTYNLLPWPNEKADWLFVDECQDLSMSQIQIILKYVKPNGRFLCVGDPYQAIYGFAGADSESYNNVKKHLKAKEFPLSISYRCPKHVVSLAQTICAEIKSADDAFEGIVTRLPYIQIHKVVKNGDMILSRTTSPLILLCIDLISKRISAKVRGRDLGKMLTIIIKEIAELKGFTYEDFLTYLEEYRVFRLNKLSGSIKNRGKIETLLDQVAGIKACYEGFINATSIDQLCTEIDNLFSDNISPVLLCTIHRAKGLETNRIFILDYDALPHKYPEQRPWEIEQERNCHYVAITRAKKELYQVYIEPVVNNSQPMV